MLFLSSGGGLQEYTVQYNAPLYNQLENSKSSAIIAFLGFQNETKKRVERSAPFCLQVLGQQN